MLPKQTIINQIFLPGAGTLCGPFAIEHETGNLHLPDACGNSWKVDLSKTGMTCMFKRITGKLEKGLSEYGQNRNV